MSQLINFPKRKVPSPNGFTGEFYKTFEEEIILIPHNQVQKIKAEGRLPNSSYKDCPINKIVLLTKSGKSITKKIIITTTEINSHKNRYKILN